MADETDFVRAMLADIPPPPPRAAEIRAINSGRMAAAE
jgi:hydroxyacylglutathione hydrolase